MMIFAHFIEILAYIFPCTYPKHTLINNTK